MAYVIYTRDKPGRGDIRDGYREAHWAYLESRAEVLWASGGLFEEDGGHAVGGLIIIDVESREKADAFVRGDPFVKADLFERVEVLRWKRSFFEGKRSASEPGARLGPIAAS
jgi:uncharacterized protein YciI